MTLDEFMTWKGLSDAEMGRRIGVQRNTVFRYRKGERRPTWPILERIRDESGGIVTADSFMRPRRQRRGLTS
jgi:transcriptional regulator with XRE-family HTH domain